MARFYLCPFGLEPAATAGIYGLNVDKRRRRWLQAHRKGRGPSHVPAAGCGLCGLSLRMRGWFFFSDWAPRASPSSGPQRGIV